jgi:phenolic acid decarboxylase
MVGLIIQLAPLPGTKVRVGMMKLRWTREQVLSISMFGNIIYRVHKIKERW